MISPPRLAGGQHPLGQSLSILCRFALLLGTVYAADPIIVKPQESDELFANPGMGWETFNRPSNQDKNLPSWIPSTVEYARWSWSQLEPQQGKLNTEFLDQELQKARDSGQKLAFRVKCCAPLDFKGECPSWLKEVGGKMLMVDYGDAKELTPIPDLDDPVVLNSHLDFIRMMGKRYDGNPDIDHLDLGSIGWWGEWHLSRCKLAKLPTLENRMKVVMAYLEAFKKTPLVMLIGGQECTSFATQHGAGWRADSMGDLGSFSPNWNHMRNKYPQLIKETQIQDVWKVSPVAFEPPEAVSEFMEKGWPLRWIFNYALALHGSYFNGKSGKLPDDCTFKEEMQRFLKRLGYRLVLTELSHPAEVKIGGELPLLMKWRNIGSAPCYRPYRVACQLSNKQGYRRVFVTSGTVNHWMPGSIELFTEDFFKEPQDLPPGELYSVSDTVALPSDIPAGEYALSMGIVDEHSEIPAIRLGIVGKDSEGWYPVSNLKVIP